MAQVPDPQKELPSLQPHPAWICRATTLRINPMSNASSSDRDDVVVVQGPEPAQIPAASTPISLAGVLHHSNFRRRRLSLGVEQSVANFEFHSVVGLMGKNLFSTRTWIDSLHVMRLVVVNAAMSAFCAWVTVVLYAIGSPFAPFLFVWTGTMWSPPEWKAADPAAAATQFNAAVGAYFVLFVCVAHVTAKSFTTSSRLFTFSAGASFLDLHAPRFWVLFLRNLQTTGVVLLAVVAAGVSVMELLQYNRVDLRVCGRVHVYFLSTIGYAYVVFSEVQMRRALLNRARQTLTLRLSSSISPAPLGEILTPATAPDMTKDPSFAVSQANPQQAITIKKRSVQQPRVVALGELVWQLLHAQVIPVATFHLMFLFLQVAAALELRQRWEIMLFAASSLVLKISLQEATKRFQLDGCPKRQSARMIHTAMTVPTICIDAPLRLVFIQKGVKNDSLMVKSLIIVLFEIVFRMAKILRLRYMLTARLASLRIIKRVRRRVNSRLAQRDLARARIEYSRFLDWKNYKLGVHAAEVYADMHGKYISIGVATAVLYILRTHPRYDLGSMATTTETLLSMTVQLVTGLVADFVSCAFEGVQEVPLYESLVDEGRALLRFLNLLMCVLTMINVGVIALFALHPT